MSRSEARGFKDHFSAKADAYATYRPEYPAALFAYLESLTGQPDRAWDCATGNGQAARGLAGYFREVIATDASAEQIRNALPHPSVDYRVAPAEDSGLAPGSVDLVSVAQAAHWFDLPRFYAEVRRVLRPGGVVALWCYERLSVNPEVDAVIDAFYTRTLGPYWPPERRWVETGYRDLPFPFAELGAPALEMSANWNLEQLIGYFSTWSALKGYRTACGHDPLPSLRIELERHWISLEQGKNIKWPLSLRLGRI